MLQDLLVAALDPPRDQPVAGFPHQLQHLLIHVVHPAVARPPDVDLLFDHPLAQLHHLLPVHREQVGVHVDVVDALLLQLPQLLHDQLRRPQPRRVLVAHVLDAVRASRRAAPAGHDKRERSLDQRHAVLLQGQQLVHRDRHVVHVSYERPRKVQHDLFPVAPRQPLDPVHVHRPVFLDRRLVLGVVLLEQRLDLFRALLELVLQVVQKVTDGQVRLAHQHVVQRRVRSQRLLRDGRHVRPKRYRLRPARLRQEAAVHVVFQCRRSHLGHVVLRLVLVQQLAELRPAHALGVGVDDRQLIHRVQQGCHLGQ
jgi:hypothetical protein